MIGIIPPGCQCSMEHLAFNVYAYHQQEIENFINHLAKSDDPNDFYTQRVEDLNPLIRLILVISNMMK